VERLILDTTVLVSVERTASSLDAVIDDEDDVAIAAITAAELLVGVELAGAEHKEPRRGLVDDILSAIPIEPYDLTSREHMLAFSHTYVVRDGREARTTC